MRSNRLGEVFKMFFNMRVLPLFIIGSIMLSVAGNSVYALLVNLIGNDLVGNLVILVSTSLILLFIAYLISIILKFLHSKEAVIINQPHPQKRRGLIFLVSQTEPLEKAFIYHQPTLSHCWLICSKDTLQMATEFKEANEKKIVRLDIKVINDPFDWQDTKRIIDDIYKSLPKGIAEKDVITDFLGLTKPASVGAVLSCLIPGRPLEYIPAKFEMRNNKLVPILAGDPIEIVIDYESIKA